jgi:hypothetical protein
MNREELGDCFQLNNNRTFHQQVDSVAQFDPDLIVDDRKLKLRGDFEPSLLSS